MRAPRFAYSCRRWLGRLRLAAAEEGVAAVELALLAPVLIIFLLGVLDVGWRLVAEYRLTRAASAAADLTARAHELHVADVEDAFRAASEIASPFRLESSGHVVLSSVLEQDGNGAVILWQQRFPADSGGISRIGAVGERADLGDLRLQAGESVIVAEVFFTFEPLVGFLLSGPSELYFRWVAAPRFGTLSEVLP